MAMGGDERRIMLFIYLLSSGHILHVYQHVDTFRTILRLRRSWVRENGNSVAVLRPSKGVHWMMGERKREIAGLGSRGRQVSVSEEERKRKEDTLDPVSRFRMHRNLVHLRHNHSTRRHLSEALKGFVSFCSLF